MDRFAIFPSFVIKFWYLHFDGQRNAQINQKLKLTMFLFVMVTENIRILSEFQDPCCAFADNILTFNLHHVFSLFQTKINLKRKVM